MCHAAAGTVLSLSLSQPLASRLALASVRLAHEPARRARRYRRSRSADVRSPSPAWNFVLNLLLLVRAPCRAGAVLSDVFVVEQLTVMKWMTNG